MGGLWVIILVGWTILVDRRTIRIDVMTFMGLLMGVEV